MRCSKCNGENRDGRKFCSECGAPMPFGCPQCGASNEAGEKFCGECGATLTGAAPAKALKPSASKPTAPGIRVTPEQLDASTPLDGERKTVTALFADIKGSTELEQDLDPEEARAIIDPALKLMIEAVRRYDGYIVQSTGDGIFALFGAPVAHEDHPQRALYAALRMQEELHRYSARLREAGNLPLEARVGVNTGEVVVRSIATGQGQTEYTPIGHTTNLASRMQALAPTGSIAISEQTRKFVEGYFALKELGPTKVKGVAEPVKVYEVTGLGPLRTRLQRSAGRGLTKFVGREREMEAMRSAAELARAGRGQIVAAMAEAGTGKSRLFFEFKAKNQSGWMVLETFSVSHGKASAYLPVLDLLHGYFKIAGEDDQRTRREKVTGRVIALDRNLEDTLPYLFSLLGIVEGDDSLAQMDGQIKKRRTLEAIKRIILRESLNQPLMVIFEDLHWIDEETQALLNLLADSIATAKLILLVNYRPEYSHQWHNRTYYTQLRLDPLGKDSAEEMLSALLGDDPEFNSLKRLIVGKTEGNPFFMEETMQVLLDEGALVRNGKLRLTRPLSELKIPPTVQAILASRIDRLAPALKDLLQTLAVAGKEFALPLIRHVANRSADEVDRMLNELQLAEFIYEQPAVGETEYVFKHALTQEVTYNSVLSERRKALHERIGAGIENVFAGALDDHLSELAHHYGRSGNLAKAIEYLARSARPAMQRSAYREAISALTQARDLAQGIPDELGRVRIELELQGDLAECATALYGPTSPQSRVEAERALAVAEKLNDEGRIFKALNALMPTLQMALELDRMRKVAERLLAMGQVQNNPLIIATGYGHMANVLFYRGSFEESLKHIRKANDIELSDEMFRSFPLFPSLMGSNGWMLGYPEQARRHADHALALAGKQPSELFLAVTTTWNFRIMIWFRDPAFIESARAFVNLTTDRGYTGLRLWANLYYGWASAMHDDAARGLAILESGWAKLVESSPGPTYVRALYAEALLKNARYDDALHLIAESIRLSDETDERIARAELHRLHGQILLAENDANNAEAERAFRIALDVAREQHAKSWELRATTSLARLLRDTGRRDEARSMLADIYNWFTEGFDTADLKDAKALLERLNA